MVYLWDSENSMKPTCWCPNPCALGCQTLAVDRHHSKLTIGRACDDSVLTDSQCGEAQNVGHFDEFKSRKAMQVRRYHKVKIRCSKKTLHYFRNKLEIFAKTKQNFLFLLAFQLQSNNHGLCNLHHSINRHRMTLNAILVKHVKVGPCRGSKQKET